MTVGMMTTGYDCTDILNIGLFRPIFSPTDFVQIKGRGTRKHDFREELDWQGHGLKMSRIPTRRPSSSLTFSPTANTSRPSSTMTKFSSFRREVAVPPLKDLLKASSPNSSAGMSTWGEDHIHAIAEEAVGPEGMKIDRMLFDRFAHTVRSDEAIRSAVEAGEWERVLDYVNREVFDKPEEYYNMQKLRKAAAVDRRLTLREILERVFDLIPSFKSRDQLLEEEFAKFLADSQPQSPDSIPALNAYFKAYATDVFFRDIIDKKQYTRLATYQGFPLENFRALPQMYRQAIPEYIKDYVSLNQFSP